MGAWGHESFANDDALDWVFELEESSDASCIRNALTAVTDDGEGRVEAPDCCMAIAAAEVVAALRGNGLASLPEEVSEWLQGKPAPDAELVAQARQATDVVMSRSELKELWKENAEDYPKWTAAVEDLRSRLS